VAPAESFPEMTPLLFVNPPSLLGSALPTTARNIKESPYYDKRQVIPLSCLLIAMKNLSVFAVTTASFIASAASTPLAPRQADVNPFLGKTL
jgi:hypothetical protein